MFLSKKTYDFVLPGFKRTPQAVKCGKFPARPLQGVISKVELSTPTPWCEITIVFYKSGRGSQPFAIPNLESLRFGADLS